MVIVIRLIEDIDIPATQKEIKVIEAKLAKTQKELDKYLGELGLK